MRIFLCTCWTFLSQGYKIVQNKNVHKLLDTMQRILITGGAGYIGSHTVYAALDNRFKVAVVDDLSTGHRECLPDNIPFYQTRIQNRTEMDRIFQDFAPDAVIHFAGSIIVPESVKNPTKYYQNNTVASLGLIEGCIKHNIKTFIFSSTAAVYGMPKEDIVDEQSPTTPINPYGWSKLMIEQMLSDTTHAHDLNFAALRYFNVAGADPKGRTGQSTPNATHLIKVACETALGQRPSMKIYGTDYDTPDGTCIRDFIHVNDLANAHLAVLDYIQNKRKSVTLNCGNGKGYSVKEVLESVKRVSGKSFATEEAGRRAGDPPKLIAAPSQLQQLTGWNAQYTDLDKIIATALEWEKKQASKHN